MTIERRRCCSCSSPGWARPAWWSPSVQGLALRDDPANAWLLPAVAHGVLHRHAVLRPASLLPA